MGRGRPARSHAVLAALLSPGVVTGNLLLPVMLGASGTHFPITHPAPVRGPVLRTG